MAYRRRDWWLGLGGVLMLTVLVYLPTLRDPFAGDDYLVLGPVRNSAPWALIGNSIILRDNIPYWRPLVSPLYALEVHGLGLHPLPYHLIALGLHLVCVVLLARIGLALTGRPSVGLAGALLWGAGAAHATAVAQISSTVELLSVPFYFGAVLCVVQWTRHDARSGRWRYLAALALFVLGILAKESVASAAGVITVLFGLALLAPGRNGHPLAHRLRAFVAAVAPFWLVVLPYIAFTYLTDRSDPTGIANLMYHPGVHVFENLWWLLARLAWPAGVGSGTLAPDGTFGAGPPVALAGHIGAGLLVVAGLYVLWRGPHAARALVLWTVIALTPLTPWLPQLMLGRFTYQAAAPFALLVAWGGAVLAGRVGRHLPSVLPRWAMGVALLAFLVSFNAPLTVVHNRERSREAADYQLLVSALRRELPEASEGTRVEIVGGPWRGPYHALYLAAVVDTLYGAGRVHIEQRDAVTGSVVRVDGRVQSRPPEVIVLAYARGELHRVL